MEWLFDNPVLTARNTSFVETSLKLMRGSRGIACGFILFIVVCYVLHLPGSALSIMENAPGLGLLLFVLPGAIASGMARHRRLTSPVVGALLALPVCLLMMLLWLSSPRSLPQQLAWLFSALFWTSLGALCLQAVRAMLRLSRRAKRRDRR